MMPKITDAICECCGLPMLWETAQPGVCSFCLVTGRFLHPEQIAKTEQPDAKPDIQRKETDS